MRDVLRDSGVTCGGSDVLDDGRRRDDGSRRVYGRLDDGWGVYGRLDDVRRVYGSLDDGRCDEGRFDYRGCRKYGSRLEYRRR